MSSLIIFIIEISTDVGVMPALANAQGEPAFCLRSTASSLLSLLILQVVPGAAGNYPGAKSYADSRSQAAELRREGNGGVPAIPAAPGRAKAKV
jgi:hypothetical protein